MDAPLPTQPLPLSLHKTLYVFKKDIGSVIIADVAVVTVRPQQIRTLLLKTNTNKRNTVSFAYLWKYKYKTCLSSFKNSTNTYL